MARTDPDGTRHPTGSDLFNISDGEHVSQCPACRAEYWAPLLIDAWENRLRTR